MALNRVTRRLARFGAFEVDMRTGELRKGGTRIRLQQKSFEVLKLLLERPAEVVDREFFQAKLWPDQTFVDFDEGLNSAVWKLRQALSDSAESPKYIETLARLGYRFVAPVSFAPLEDSGESRPISIGVLPFRDRTGNSDTEYLSFGIAEDITAVLTRVSELRVIGPSSMSRFAQQRKNAGALARELSLASIVRGEVGQHGKDFWLQLELADAETEALLWARTYRLPAAGISQQLQAIAADLADALQVRLSPAKEVLRHSQNSDAYQLYLKGRNQWKKRTAESLKKAVSLFQDALEIDPMYSLAYAGLADTYTLLGATGYKAAIQHDCMRKAKAAAMKALEIDPNVAEAHASLAFVSFRFDWNWQEAERQFLAAIQIDPNYVTAHHWFAIFLSAMTRHEEALSHIQMAQDLDPLSTIVNAAAGRVHYFARNYECALNIYKTALETDPHFAQCHFDAGMVYLQLNCIEKAIAEFQQAAALSGRSLTLALLGVSYARAHRRDDAVELLGNRAPDEQALVYTALEEREPALRCLEDAYREHAGSLAYLKVEPLWDALRTEARFGDLLRRMQLLP